MKDAGTPVGLTTEERRAAVAMARALSDIREARVRQVREKGYSPDHDDQYRSDELERAAATYALARTYPQGRLWPWHPRYWKPRSHRENLVRAGALIVAAIEKIDRDEGRAR
jgi:hypothetical protein